jgi:pantoate--beta-alanine ligase
MQVIESVEEMQALAMSFRFEGQLIGLVPTMGCLHEGHISLIKKARESADKVIVSIFVNPTQFAPSEDYGDYPRTLEADLEQCKKYGVDIVFTPSKETMFPQGFSSYVIEESVGSGLCGISRPNHFKGVTTVCLKLFNLARPDFSYFGQKDAQQCAVLKKVVKDLNVPTEIVVCDTIRESDGLALSSRNRSLSKLQREDALYISKALFKAKEMAQNGVSSPDRIVAEITHIMGLKRRIRIIYIQVVNKDSMEPVRKIDPEQTIVSLAVWIDNIRLIDNIAL